VAPPLVSDDAALTEMVQTLRAALRDVVATVEA
jgi:hypothetical protein